MHNNDLYRMSGKAGRYISGETMTIIPPITHPLGTAWKQTDTNKILLDDECAIMDQATLRGLKEYSTSQPSGVYPGKMWKRKWQNKWWLCWYGDHPDPRKCSNHIREIVVI